MKYPALIVSVGMGISMILAFQNCGKVMKGTTALTAASTQCMAKTAEATLLEKARLGDLKCDDAIYYQCEKRVFQPGLAQSSGFESVCAEGLTGCAPARVFTFDTSAAERMPDVDPAEFRVGGEYHREEINCAYVEDGNVLLKAEGGALSLALAAAQGKCREAVSAAGAKK
ncbi:MAG: hypothetical protein K2X47_13365 [Bdellovibrionales bacterium]|nr:hypothetical protein [Bdellovibrionales bacterium]